jgi:serine/threonine protein kinase
VKLEEEAWSWYSANHFYPVAIGEIFNNTYQVVAKLGYGTASTTWLCRDLRNHRYVTLKVYASNSPQNAREVAALGHIRSILARPGPSARHTIDANSIRILLDDFRIPRPWPSRTNLCLVFDPLSVSLADTRKVVYGGRMDLNMARCVAFYILQALDFLHRKANLVHAGTFSSDIHHQASRVTVLTTTAIQDIQEDNIMFAVEHCSEWQHVEEAEMADPSPRKIHKGRTVHSTRFLAELPTPTTPVLCDFGEARFGKDEYAEDAMPDLYRAPEILLRIAWTEKIDIWALGLMVKPPLNPAYKSNN